MFIIVYVSSHQAGVVHFSDATYHKITKNIKRVLYEKSIIYNYILITIKYISVHLGVSNFNIQGKYKLQNIFKGDR